VRWAVSAGEPTRDAADPLRRYYGGSVQAEHVLCCVPQEGVLLMHALLSPGQHVVVTAPGYQSLYGLAKAMG
jgi:aspartate/methionine/tyrosine aminotransferase